jgi:hypothetical protein
MDMMKKATPRKRFVLELEFDVFGEQMNNVVTTCAQLNLHTEDTTIQGAMNKLNEAILIFFDTAEARMELGETIDELVKDDLDMKPWSV